MKRIISILGLILITCAVNARQVSSDIAFKREIEIASILIDEGEYDSADYLLRHVLQNMKILPNNISFYFGKNSFYLKRYKQSINWLNKYMELVGTSGQFFEESVTLLDKAEQQYRVERSVEIAEMVKKLNEEETVSCEDSDKVICPVCHGLGVVIKEVSFGKEYLPCPFSDERGLLSCPDYKLLMEGKLKPKY